MGFAVNENEHIIYILEFKSIRRWGKVCCRDPERSRAPARCWNARPYEAFQGHAMDIWTAVICSGAQVGVCKRMAWPSLEVWCQQRGQSQDYEISGLVNFGWTGKYISFVLAHPLGCFAPSTGAGGCIEVSKVQGKGSLADYYYLNVGDLCINSFPILILY
jgi:hypothetical protein